MDAQLELQKAVVTALKGDATLTAIVPASRITDCPAESIALPYVDVGEAEGRDWGAKSFVGMDHYLTLHVWSKKRGKKECFDIISAIHDVLHEQQLSVTGHALVILRFSESRVFRDADGLTYHGTAEFRAITQDT